MTILSNVSGATVLSGEDARKFRLQATYGRPRSAARDSAIRGAKLLKQLKELGYVLVQTNR
jgi:hypothetical protein